MLRITSSAKNGTTWIRLEGRLVGPWVDECRATCETSRGQRLALDVSEVRFADPRGVELLRELDDAGLVMRGNGYTAELMRRGDSMKLDHEGRSQGASSTGESAGGLVSRLRAGQEEACEELVRHHGGAMLETARRYLSCETEAVEALKEAFQVAFRAAGDHADDPELEVWLHRIVVDVCLARLRPAMSLAVPLDGLLPAFDQAGQHAAPVAAWMTPAGSVAAEARKAVRRHIAALPAPYRVLLLLCDAEGLTTREAARRLAIPHFEAASRLHRARQALRTLLANRLTGLTPA